MVKDTDWYGEMEHLRLRDVNGNMTGVVLAGIDARSKVESLTIRSGVNTPLDWRICERDLLSDTPIESLPFLQAVAYLRGRDEFLGSARHQGHGGDRSGACHCLKVLQCSGRPCNE